jgi:hypothetical protein
MAPLVRSAREPKSERLVVTQEILPAGPDTPPRGERSSPSVAMDHCAPVDPSRGAVIISSAVWQRAASAYVQTEQSERLDVVVDTFHARWQTSPLASTDGRATRLVSWTLSH